MWLFRTLALILALGALGACGFRPLYGGTDDTSAPAEFAAIEIKPIADRIGQQLHNRLLDYLNPRGRPSAPRYILRVSLAENVERLAVEKNAFATRANVWLRASYSLHEAKGGKPLLSANDVVVSSYNILRSDFATLQAQRDAETRATRELGNDIRLRLAAFFQRGGATEKP